jgi:dCMP deaminase
LDLKKYLHKKQMQGNSRPSWDDYFMKIANVVKLRSNDFTQVGAVLVSILDKRIISTGYNSQRSGIDDSASCIIRYL